MKDLITRWLYDRIGINYLRPHHIDPAQVVAVEADYFTIRGEEDGALHYFPYGSVIQIAEKEGGLTIGGRFTHKQHFTVVIKIRHMVDFVPVA